MSENVVKAGIELCERWVVLLKYHLFKPFNWIPVTKRLPEHPKYDWVLVKTQLVPEGGSGVPHVAELRDGVWYCDCCDTPMEETLGVKVVAWFDMRMIKDRGV